MKNNNHYQLSKDKDEYDNIRLRRTSKIKQNKRTTTIISISLIIVIITLLVINLYLSTLLHTANKTLKIKSLFFIDILKELEMKENVDANARQDKDDMNVSVMLSQISFNNAEKKLKLIQNQREDLLKTLNQIKQNKKDGNSSDNGRRLGNISSSTIITAYQKNKIEEWTSGLIGVLCYRKSKDGCRVDLFHKYCDSFSATVTLITSKNEEIFGGFTRRKWDGELLKYDPYAFLFSLSKMKVYHIGNNLIAIRADPYFFPSFGLNDIIITEKEATISKKLRSFTGDFKDYELNNGNKDLDIQEIEVFEIITITDNTL